VFTACFFSGEVPIIEGFIKQTSNVGLKQEVECNQLHDSGDCRMMPVSGSTALKTTQTLGVTKQVGTGEFAVSGSGIAANESVADSGVLPELVTANASASVVNSEGFHATKVITPTALACGSDEKSLMEFLDESTVFAGSEDAEPSSAIAVPSHPGLSAAADESGQPKASRHLPHTAIPDATDPVFNCSTVQLGHPTPRRSFR
jgi:hypothetical protein